MSFKRNLPIFIGFWLLVAGLLGLVFFVQRPEEELLHDAAATYGATQGPVRDVQVHGSQVDIAFTGRPTLFAEFAKQGGNWTFLRDLGADFERIMKERGAEQEMLRRLGQKISDTWQMNVTLKEGNYRFGYALGRPSQDLQGDVVLTFSYPKQGDQQPLGMYVESYRYADGQWRTEGKGRLINQVPPRPR